MADCLQGFFNAYGNSARKDDVDFVVHVSLESSSTVTFAGGSSIQYCRPV
jgi:hypothetical protein